MWLEVVMSFTVTLSKFPQSPLRRPWWRKRRQTSSYFMCKLLDWWKRCPGLDLPLRSCSDVNSCLAVPENSQVLAGEVDHGVIAGSPELKLWASPDDSGRALRQYRQYRQYKQSESLKVYISILVQWKWWVFSVCIQGCQSCQWSRSWSVPREWPAFSCTQCHSHSRPCFGLQWTPRFLLHSGGRGRRILLSREGSSAKSAPCLSHKHKHNVSDCVDDSSGRVISRLEHGQVTEAGVHLRRNRCYSEDLRDDKKRKSVQAIKTQLWPASPFFSGLHAGCQSVWSELQRLFY